MNRRIKNKIEKRAGFKNWNRYWLYKVDVTATETINKLRASDPDTSNDDDIHDMVYMIVSRKVRKRKILKLCLLQNCYPVPTSTPGEESEKSIEFSSKMYSAPTIAEIAANAELGTTVRELAILWQKYMGAIPLPLYTPGRVTARDICQYNLREDLVAEQDRRIRMLMGEVEESGTPPIMPTATLPSFSEPTMRTNLIRGVD